ncbi:hypothetical protein A2880_00990 [Candidatus Peribacteria bacterium RIFCSPHIGHO2_01_FULL_49_38]|nr:MAG: hypothetical protein A2880_00990 [Candidatus Peribacteria bacterium RIFCSPHIGHO2_01_FULL_49_38]
MMLFRLLIIIMSGLGCAVVGAIVLFSHAPALQARLAPVPVQHRIPWHFITQEDITNGTTVLADTHVAFHLPDTFDVIDGDILFGRQGDKVRYWGYCLPQNYDPQTALRRSGLPGLLFLSKAEQEVRRQLELPPEKRFSIRYPPLTKAELEPEKRKASSIRHQFNDFKPSQLCYVMTAAALLMGLDTDGDGLNTKFEQMIGTHPEVADTDGDGLDDGVEYFYGSRPLAHHLSGERAGLNPLLQDSDLDGIIDGIEDANRNGGFDQGETDPRKKDTDRDGLCDGLCMTKIGRMTILLGEDKNLNGQVDEGETDPRKADSNGDDIPDFQAYFNCQAGMEEYCMD